MEANVLKMFSGDDEPIRIEFRAPNGQPVNLPSAGVQDIQFSVKDDSGRELIYKSLVNTDIIYTTDGSDGLSDIYMLQDDTYSLEGKFEYDIQIKKDDRINTVVKAFLIIVKDINERSS